MFLLTRPGHHSSPSFSDCSHSCEEMKRVSYENIRETYFAMLDNIDEQDLALPGRIMWSAAVNYFISFPLISLLLLLFCFPWKRTAVGERNEMHTNLEGLTHVCWSPTLWKALLSVDLEGVQSAPSWTLCGRQTTNTQPVDNQRAYCGLCPNVFDLSHMHFLL